MKELSIKAVYYFPRGFPGGSAAENPAANARGKFNS